MKTKFNTTMGQFKVSGEAEVTDAQADILRDLGTLQVVQRVPFSAAEKSMAGYSKRPKEFKRVSIPFNDENTLKFLAVLEAPVEIAEGVEITLSNVEITQHVPTITEVKYAAERAKYASKNAVPAALKKLADAVSYTGELGDGTAENAPVEFLEAIKSWIKSQLESV